MSTETRDPDRPPFGWTTVEIKREGNERVGAMEFERAEGAMEFERAEGAMEFERAEGATGSTRAGRDRRSLRQPARSAGDEASVGQSRP